MNLFFRKSSKKKDEKLIPKKIEEKDFTKVREKVGVGILSILLSLFIVFGRSYEFFDSWTLVLENKLQITKSILLFIIVSFMFFIAISVVFFLVDCLDVGKKNYNNVICCPYFELLHRKPMGTTFFLLMIIYIPYILCNYPIVFMGDSFDQVLQGFNIPAVTANSIQLIAENVTLNNHHPVIHTILLHFFIILGYKIHSYNFGAFLYAMFAFCMVILTVALSVRIMIRRGIADKWIVFVLLYFAFTPHMQEYMFLCTKDVFFAILLLLFYLILFDFCEINSKIQIVLLNLISIGIVLFRNEGKYFLFISLAIILIVYKPYRRRCLIALATIIVFSVFYTSYLLPVNQITPGSSREMLSIPFQQTARYVRDCGEEITEEEKDAISQILDFDNLAETYNPNLSDPVKDAYNKYATEDDLKNYFKVWLKMGLKHPKVYVQAILNNKYQFFYPVFDVSSYYDYENHEFYSTSYSEEVMHLINRGGTSVGLNFSYPEKLSKLRRGYENVLETVWDFPILSCFKTTAIYTWIIFIWSMYCIIKRDRKHFLCTIPYLVQLCICMAGPANGYYFRYMYPMAFGLPIIILLCKVEDRRKGNI